MNPPLSLFLLPHAAPASSVHRAGADLHGHATALRDRAMCDDALARWTRLAHTLRLPVFLTPDWMACWLGQLMGTGGPTAPVWLLSVQRGEHDVGLAFVVRGPARRLAGLPFAPAWHLHATGGALDELCAEYNDLLVDPALPEARGLLIEQWRRLGRGPRELHLAHLGRAPERQVWEQALQPRHTRLAVQSHAKPSFSIDLQRVRDAGHSLLALRSANLRSQVRRAMKAYAALGALQLAAAPDLYTAAEWFKRLAQLHQQHWHAQGRPGAFANDRFVAFHQALMQRCGVDAGRATHVQLLRLRAGEHDVAYLYNLVHQGHVVFYQSGLDYAVGGKQARPGYVAHVLAAEHNARLGHAVYDFLMGASRYKRDLATDQCEMHSVVLQTPGWRFAAERGLRALRAGCQGPRTTAVNEPAGTT